MPFKRALIGSTALIGGSFIAPAAALAVSCPSDITGAGLTGVVCDFDSGNSVTVANGGDVGGINMNSYAPASSFITNNGTVANTTGASINISTSSLTGGIINSGTITNGAGVGITINNTSAINGGIANSGNITSGDSVITISQSAVNNGINNSGTMVSTTLGTGLRIIGSSTITGGITNSGTITGSNVDPGVAIINSSVSGGITNSGSINAANGDAFILRSGAITGGITNSGTISSTGGSGLSIFNVSTVTGDIVNETGGSMSGANAGLTLHNATTLNGSITNQSGATISGNNVGIYIYSATHITGGITNNGTVTGSTSGILISSTSTVTGAVTNTGTVTGGNYGMVIDSNSSATLVNNGTINVTNASGRAMHNGNSNGNTLTNNGTINYIIGAYGISSVGDSNTLTNNGSMEVRFGISSDGDHNVLTNYGSILSHGILGGGLSESHAGDSQLINYGSIVTTGDSATGLKGVDGNTLVNNGYIRAGFGIQGTGDGITVINRGTIANFDSILLTGSNNSVTLGMNSYTRGTITFAGATNALTYDVSNTPRTGGVIYVGDAIAGADTTTIANTASLPAGARIVQNGGSLVVLTPDQFVPTHQVISQTLADAGTILNNRQQFALLGDTTEAAGGTQYAASTATLSDAGDPGGWAVRDRKVAWTEGFGSYQERGSNGDMLETKARAGGVMAGIDLPQNDSGYRSGLYVGGFMGRLNAGSSFRTIDSTGGMAGGYVGRSFGGTYVSSQLGFGFSSNESDRFTGVDMASADYNSYFVSPSLTVMHPVRATGVTWVPSATARYTAQFDDSYLESGSVVNQGMDSHTSHSLDGRMMLEAKFDPSQWEYGTLKTSLRAGIQGQTLIGSNKVNMQALGTNLSFDPKGGDNYVDGVFGANVAHALNDRLDLYGDAEGNLGLNKGGAGSNKGVVGRIGARWKL